MHREGGGGGGNGGYQFWPVAALGQVRIGGGMGIGEGDRD